MTKKKKPPVKNKYAKDLRTPKYKMRVVKDKRRKVDNEKARKETEE